ncbi:MAG: hypothetical protein EOM55_05545 [Clostridia bacterium]|nr:hypothetical protein [Clostridia bacterium]
MKPSQTAINECDEKATSLLNRLKRDSLNTKRSLNKEYYVEAYLIKINYKSGISESFWCIDFECKYSGSDIVSIRWTRLFDGYHPILVGVDNIESIFVADRAALPKETFDLIENHETE